MKTSSFDSLSEAQQFAMERHNDGYTVYVARYSKGELEMKARLENSDTNVWKVTMNGETDLWKFTPNTFSMVQAPATTTLFQEKSDEQQPLTKVCKTCGRTLPIEKFPKNHTYADGHANKCKECVNEERKDKRRAAAYVAQPGKKATLSLADFKDSELFAELKRRSWSGELTYTKVVSL